MLHAWKHVPSVISKFTTNPFLENMAMDQNPHTLHTKIAGIQKLHHPCGTSWSFNPKVGYKKNLIEHPRYGMLSPIITLVECLKPGYNPGEISPISPSTAPSDARCSGCSCHVSSPHRVSRGRICWRIRLQRSWRQSTSNDWRKVGSTVHRRNQMRKFWDL